MNYKKKTDIKIGNKTIGEDSPCFFLAEIGPNHNGDIKIARELIDAASDAGADAVKVQTFEAKRYIAANTPKAEYDIKNTGTDEEMLVAQKNYELSQETHLELKAYSESKGITFFSTPHANEWSVDLLEEIGVPAYKIASGEITNTPILEYIAGKKKPVLLSTGASTMEDIERAVKAITGTGNDELIVMHCTSDYPCDIKDTNLNVLATLKKKFDLMIGYSDHTLSNEVACIAVALGAKVIEKHITLDRNMYGPDHKSSIEPHELSLLIQKIREVEVILGSSEKKPTAEEAEVSKIIRKSIVANQDIPGGVNLTKQMLTFKRPGTGIPPYELENVIGKKTTKDIKMDTLISYENLL